MDILHRAQLTLSNKMATSVSFRHKQILCWIQPDVSQLFAANCHSTGIVYRPFLRQMQIATLLLACNQIWQTEISSVLVRFQACWLCGCTGVLHCLPGQIESYIGFQLCIYTESMLIRIPDRMKFGMQRCIAQRGHQWSSQAASVLVVDEACKSSGSDGVLASQC